MEDKLRRQPKESVKINSSHRVLLDNRKKGNITGVVDVISFDLKEILLETSMGMLTIKGQDLKVTRLSVEKGELDLAGQIDSMAYSEVNSYAGKTESFLTRMFK